MYMGFIIKLYLLNLQSVDPLKVNSSGKLPRNNEIGIEYSYKIFFIIYYHLVK